MKCIKGAIQHIDSQEKKRILHPCFRLRTSPSTWSFGYCDCIAQVVALVFRSQGMEVIAYKGDKDK